MTSSAIIVTNCTQRKRASGEVLTLTEDQLNGCLDDVAHTWAHSIGKARATLEAQNLYMGRSFSDAKRVAAAAIAPLYVVSAGLGLVNARKMVPAYDLTVAKGSTPLAPYLTRLGKTPADWWTALTAELGDRGPIRALIKNHDDALFLLALPASYIALIAAELASISRDNAGRIRIFTSELGAGAVPTHLRHVVLPYDERLEGSKYRGTRTDFPQRALRHFVEALSGHSLPLDAARQAVLDAMQTCKKPILPTRSKKTDAEILALLRVNWQRYNGLSSRLLRYLRDEALVACEQSRFRTLWRTMQQELATGELSGSE